MCDTFEQSQKECEQAVEIIARICHEANKAYCESMEDFSQLPWDEAPEWQKNSAFNGVLFHMEHPDALPSASHESWLAEKKADGWKYGPIKDADKKEHPCFVPFEDLPFNQQMKDVIFGGICKALIPEYFPEGVTTVE